MEGRNARSNAGWGWLGETSWSKGVGTGRVGRLGRRVRPGRRRSRHPASSDIISEPAGSREAWLGHGAVCWEFAFWVGMVQPHACPASAVPLGDGMGSWRGSGLVLAQIWPRSDQASSRGALGERAEDARDRDSEILGRCEEVPRLPLAGPHGRPLCGGKRPHRAAGWWVSGSVLGRGGRGVCGGGDGGVGPGPEEEALFRVPCRGAG